MVGPRGPHQGGGRSLRRRRLRDARAGHLSRGERLRTTLIRQCLFLLGKTFTYTFIGALVGALGLWIVRSGWIPGIRTVLVYAAATVTILLGILMLELPIRLQRPMIRWPGAELLQTQAFSVLSKPGALTSFVLGLAVGYLPCPLTGLLAVAAAGEHSVVKGMALLGGAGLGTIPGLLAVSVSLYHMPYLMYADGELHTVGPALRNEAVEPIARIGGGSAIVSR